MKHATKEGFISHMQGFVQNFFLGGGGGGVVAAVHPGFSPYITSTKYDLILRTDYATSNGVGGGRGRRKKRNQIKLCCLSLILLVPTTSILRPVNQTALLLINCEAIKITFIHLQSCSSY